MINLRTRAIHSICVNLAVIAVAAAVGLQSATVLGSAGSRGDLSAALAGPCRPQETAVVIDTRAHRLHLCAAGKVERIFVVALGRGGLGKFRTGDRKTPLGQYVLGPPRASASYHLFIPVAYPTPAQVRVGFTGSAIGIHGPPRGWSGRVASTQIVASDWTDGCIAVGSDAEIEDISAWLRRGNGRRVRLGVGV